MLTPAKSKLNLPTVMSNTPKRGRGRPKGSTSFISIKLADLVNNLGLNAKVSVSKRWLEGIGFEIEESPAPAPAPVMTISSTTDEPNSEEVIQFEIH
jgi:hypothetical protein